MEIQTGAIQNVVWKKTPIHLFVFGVTCSVELRSGDLSSQDHTTVKLEELCMFKTAVLLCYSKIGGGKGSEFYTANILWM